LATELYGLTKGEGEEWAQAAAMGVAIDSNNPLYANSGAAADGSGAMVAPTRPLDEQGLATLLAETQPSPVEKAGEDDMSFLDQLPPAVDVAPTPAAEVPPALPSEPIETSASVELSSNDLDFDLEGLNIGGSTAPAVDAPSPSTEPVTDLASIDFGFLDESKAEPSLEAEAVAHIAEPVPESGISTGLDMPAIESISDLELPSSDESSGVSASEPVLDDVGTLNIDIPGLESQTTPLKEHEEPQAKNAVDPLAFDLSDISLDLNLSDTKPEEVRQAEAEPSLEIEDLPPVDTNTTSADAEMATKLDLAIAYQEIGDKEGARELLDEVLRGGSPEQSEKAKSLLLELA
jgi:pilus assembly protein FimV